MKRVLIFSLAYYPHVGGAEVAIKEITDRISPEDIEFHMVTLRFSSLDKKEEQIGNVHVHRVGGGSAYLSKIFFVPLAALVGRRLHKKYRFGGLWAMMSYMVFPVVLLRMMGVRVPYVLNLQDGDPFERVFKRWFIPPLRPLLVYGFKKASVIQVLSTFLAEWTRKVGYRGRVEVIPNGVTVASFAGERTPHENIVVVSTSRLVTKNALDDVIRALKFLPAHIHFYNYGVGADKQKLENLARSEGVAERVHLLVHPGVPQLPAYLHAADIFVRPSRSEGFGISFVEAMAAGLPVIATQEGGISDFLFDAKKNPEKPTTGWAVEVDNPQDIARAVQDILSNPEEVRRVIDNARKLVKDQYDWGHITELMREKVFSTIL